MSGTNGIKGGMMHHGMIDTKQHKLFKVTYGKFGESLNQCYYHWCSTVPPEKHLDQPAFEEWFTKTYNLILEHTTYRTFILAHNKEDWMRFYLEWG